VNPLRGLEITAVFSEDGTVAGSAGCNDYTSPYEVDGDTITIDPATAKEKMCTEPGGMKDQEAAVTYECLADTLALRNTAEEGVLLFTGAADSG
jgi:heat shock protein HslJ